MISLIGTRPAIQVGPCQILHYDTSWLDDALRRAAAAADRHDFPFVAEIRKGVETYLETRCNLRLLSLDELFERMRHMLVRIGCESIADHLETLAPPVTLSLVRPAKAAGNGFELAFFENLRRDVAELRSAGAEELRFTGLRDATLLLCGTHQWNARCEHMLAEIRQFLNQLCHQPRLRDRPLRLRLDSDR